MKKFSRSCFIAAIVVVISGCKVGPDYEKPELTKQTGEKWSTTMTEEFATARTDLAQWWKNFNDPELTKLIEKAEKDNFDLKAARSRILQSRAIVDRNNAARLPVVDASADYTRNEQGPEAIAANTQGFGGFGGPTDPVRYDQYSTGLQASWELDLFGRVARNVEASSYSAQADLENYYNTVSILMADIARNYIEIRLLRRRIQILDRNIDSQKQSLQLAKDKADAGLGTELDALQAKANLATTTARRPELKRLLAVSLNRLSVLLGERPKGQSILKAGDLPAVPDRFYLGFPADLVNRRPDIRLAERRVAESRARVGAAIAEYFPRVSINGTFEFRSEDAIDMFDAQARSWSIGPRISLPIFRGGEISANVDLRKAQLEQSQYELQQTVIKAAEDVENAIAGIIHGKEQSQEYVAAVTASRENLDLSQNLYEAGSVDFQRVIDAQTRLANIEDEQVLAQQNLIYQVIALYRALGGGWERPAEKAESPS